MILLPIVIIQIVTITIFYERHWGSVSNNMENIVVQEINTIINIYNLYGDNRGILSNLNKLGFDISFANNSEYQGMIKDRSLLSLRRKIDKEIYYKSDIGYIEKFSKIRVQVHVNNKNILQLDFSTGKIKNPTTYIFILWILTTSILFGLISLFFMKNQVKSIVKLNKAARDFGQGRLFYFKPSGANEIRSLGLSFLKMRKRILKQIKNRTEMLAHIAHDLRTPITRIKLQLSLMNKNNYTEAININMKKIEDMINSYLTFAKEEGNEDNKSFDIIKMIKNTLKLLNDNRIVFTNNTNQNKLFITIRVNAVERALTNVIDNSIKFCYKKVSISLSKASEETILTIEDDGPGIEQKEYKKAFEPFKKLDSKVKQGFGLGLAISKNIINTHGGTISLAKSHLGGLKVIIKLPIGD
ncbi:Sensor protein RstB [Rickettsiales endosymbiont of Trichoplax sp. H2]|nr:Sensor protein RstB [Rickettsiales endosymbiont of Trichoplax sp. H2]